jgi:hypothetical protein
MSIGTILIVILILVLVGGFGPWGGATAPGGAPYRGYGFGVPFGGILGLLLSSS